MDNKQILNGANVLGVETKQANTGSQNTIYDVDKWKEDTLMRRRALIGQLLMDIPVYETLSKQKWSEKIQDLIESSLKDQKEFFKELTGIDYRTPVEIKLDKKEDETV